MDARAKIPLPVPGLREHFKFGADILVGIHSHLHRRVNLSDTVDEELVIASWKKGTVSAAIEYQKTKQEREKQQFE